MHSSTIEYLSKILEEKNLKIVFSPNSVLNVCDCEMGKKEICDAISNKLIKEISLYHNTILPIYKKLVMEISTLIENSDNGEKSISSYKIKRHPLNQYLLNAIVTDKIPDASDLELDRYNFQDTYIGEPYTIEELKALFTHPVKSLDLVLKQSIGNYTDEALKEVWDKYLSKLGSKSKLEYLDVNNSKLDVEISLIYAALINLSKDKPSWCKVDNDILYYELISKTLAFIEKIIVRYVKKYKDNVNNLLVLSLDRDNKIALVNSDLYDVFLSEGGSPETILGLFGVDSKDYIFTMNTLSYIKANAEDLNKSWERFKQILILNDKLVQDEGYKTKLSILISKVLEENITDEMKETYEIDASKVNEEISKLLKEKDSTYIRHPFKLATKILGDFVFEKTNFEHFVKSMKKYSKLMEIDKKDVFKDDSKVLATFAGVDMVIDYILDQVEISKF